MSAAIPVLETIARKRTKIVAMAIMAEMIETKTKRSGKNAQHGTVGKDPRLP